MKLEVFEYQITVSKLAIDDMNHANNVMYLQWVQDVAKKHWESKTSEALRDKYAWVVLNHYIEYKSPAYENDILALQTWIEHYQGAKSERHTRIINESNQKVLVTAKTSWCFLSKETLKPTRITEEISTLF